MKFPFPFVLLAAAGAACANPNAQPLAPVVVTATMTAQTTDESLAAVTLISREDIDQKQPLSVQDALRGVPGLNVANSGGLGQQSSVFMRGASAQHVLVLIDGIRVGSATLGLTALQDLPIDQVDHIEIVRGPRSSLYGSEAIGGVIQIFTRKGGGGFQPFARLGGGSYDSYQAAAGLSGGDQTAWYSLSGAALYSRGINACQGSATFFGGGCFTDEPDKDGYQNTSGSARLGYRFDNGMTLEGNLLQAGGLSHYDGATAFGVPNRSELMQQVIGATLRYAPLPMWNSQLRVGTSADYSDNFAGRQFVSRFNSRRVTTTWQNDFTLTQGQMLTVGFDYYKDMIDVKDVADPTPFAKTARDNTAGFLQYQGEFGGHSLNLALRQDGNAQFGEKTTGSVAWGYSFGEPLRLSASYGTAFKAPTFNDLYWPAGPFFAGNPHLKPESSESVEIGGKGRLAAVNWAVNGYFTRIDDLIIPYDPVTQRPQNVNQAEIFGMEAQVSAQVLGFDLSANLSLLDPRDRSAGGNRGNLLPRRAQQAFHFDVDRRFERFRAGLSLHQEGGRFDDPANALYLSGFTTVDLRASVELGHGLMLEGRAANLFNAQYQTVYLYNQLGTNLLLSLRWQPTP